MEIAVSIVVPVYNMERHLQECLDSIRSQTLHNIEIICIDDCSTDSSLEILKANKETDSRFILLSTPTNSGPAIARNLGLDAATGEYIAFIDPDDYYSSTDAINALYIAAKKYNSPAVAGNFSRLESSGRTIEVKNFNKEGKITINEYNTTYYYWRFIFSKNIIESKLIRFPSLRRYQDTVFLVEFFSYIDFIHTIDKVVYTYRTSKKQQFFSDEIKQTIMLGIELNLKKLHYSNKTNLYRFEVNNLKNLSFDNDDYRKYKKQLISTLDYGMLKYKILYLLTEEEEKLFSRMKTIVKKHNDNGWLIYGFGNLGISLYENCKKYANIQNIIDTNLVGLKVDNLEIENIENINFSTNKKINILLTVANTEARNGIIGTLLSAGVQKKHIFT